MTTTQVDVAAITCMPKQVLDEIGIDLTSQMVDAPTTRLPGSAVAAPAKGNLALADDGRDLLAQLQLRARVPGRREGSASTGFGGIQKSVPLLRHEEDAPPPRVGHLTISNKRSVSWRLEEKKIC